MLDKIERGLNLVVLCVSSVYLACLITRLILRGIIWLAEQNSHAEEA